MGTDILCYDPEDLIIDGEAEEIEDAEIDLIKNDGSDIDAVVDNASNDELDPDSMGYLDYDMSVDDEEDDDEDFDDININNDIRYEIKDEYDLDDEDDDEDYIEYELDDDEEEY